MRWWFVVVLLCLANAVSAQTTFQPVSFSSDIPDVVGVRGVDWPYQQYAALPLPKTSRQVGILRGQTDDGEHHYWIVSYSDKNHAILRCGDFRVNCDKWVGQLDLSELCAGEGLINVVVDYKENILFYRFLDVK